MSAVLLGHHDPNSPEWDALRSRGLGGSEVAAVVGLSPWVSRFALYHRKRGTIGKQDVNTGMDWGHRLEDAVCQAWQENHEEAGLLARKAGTYHHSERAWQLANPDRLVFQYVNSKGTLAGLLEAKTAHQYDAHAWGYGPEDIPPYYRCQVVHYMDVFGVPEHHLAVLIGGSDYREYVIPYVKDEAEWLREEGRKFWQDVVDGNPPEIDGHDATYQAVRELHPEIESGEVADLDPALYADYCARKDIAAETAAAYQESKAAVLDAIGQAQYAHVDGVRVLRRQKARGNNVALYEVPQPKHDTEPKDAA